MRADLFVDRSRARIALIGGGDATEHESGHTVAASIHATTPLTFQQERLVSDGTLRRLCAYRSSFDSYRDRLERCAQKVERIRVEREAVIGVASILRMPRPLMLIWRLPHRDEPPCSTPAPARRSNAITADRRNRSWCRGAAREARGPGTGGDMDPSA